MLILRLHSAEYDVFFPFLGAGILRLCIWYVWISGGDILLRDKVPLVAAQLYDHAADFACFASLSVKMFQFCWVAVYWHK